MENSNHVLRVGFSGAARYLVINYSDKESMEKGRTVLPGLTIPHDYPHDPVWAMLGGISGGFAEGVSVAHVDLAGNTPPDLLLRVYTHR